LENTLIWGKGNSKTSETSKRTHNSETELSRQELLRALGTVDAAGCKSCVHEWYPAIISLTSVTSVDQRYLVLSTLGWWKMSLLMAGGWNQMSFKVPSNPNHSMIL